MAFMGRNSTPLRRAATLEPMPQATSTLLTLALPASLLLSGCSTPSSLIGSWQGDGTRTDQPFTFGTVSFVGDGTFTAEARYGDVVRVQTGHWNLDGANLHLAEDDRTYQIHLKGDSVDFTDPASGNTMTLRRIR